MAETILSSVSGEQTKFVSGTPSMGTGSAGLNSQAPGQSTSVSAAAAASGGIKPGNLIAPDIDSMLFRYRSEDTPLMSIMLKAKPQKVASPIVRHFMIDEPRYEVTTNAAVTNATTKAMAVELPLEPKDQQLPRQDGTLLCHGVDGYNPEGTATTPGIPLMLLVTGHSNTGAPIVRAVNGPKESADTDYPYVPNIPAGTRCTLLSNAMSETQQIVAPDLIVPSGEELYLQKRGLTSVISDFFEAQKKDVPFSKAMIAESAILNFKTRSNRTLWAGIQGVFKVSTPIGSEDMYFTKGLRWQFKREFQHSGAWSYEDFVALAKLFFTGEDVPASAIILCGKNWLEAVQNIDFSKHPEISITNIRLEKLGWEVTNIHTVFGDFRIKREPTLDRLGWSNSAAVLGEDRIVHYTYAAEKNFSEKVEGREAKRQGLTVWDGIALKGSCHIWIDGENAVKVAGAKRFTTWGLATAPTTPAADTVYMLTAACPAIDPKAQTGTLWECKNSNWVPYTGTFAAL